MPQPATATTRGKEADGGSANAGEKPEEEKGRIRFHRPASTCEDVCDVFEVLVEAVSPTDLVVAFTRAAAI
jgi:hypothetical protein